MSSIEKTISSFLKAVLYTVGDPFILHTSEYMVDR